MCDRWHCIGPPCLPASPLQSVTLPELEELRVALAVLVSARGWVGWGGW